MKQKYYHKYEKALAKHGYRVDEHGYVWDSMGNQSAGEDNYGNVQSKDPNVTAICIEEEEKTLLAQLAKPKKKAAPKLKKVRARNSDGTLRADNPDTPDVNEAWTYIEDGD